MAAAWYYSFRIPSLLEVDQGWGQEMANNGKNNHGLFYQKFDFSRKAI